MATALKIAVLGDEQCGKSKLLHRFTHNTWEEGDIVTIGLENSVRQWSVFGSTIRIDLWELAGRHHYRALVPMVIAGAHIILICYDASNPEGHSCVAELVELVDRHNTSPPGQLITAIVACKDDLLVAAHESKGAVHTVEEAQKILTQEALAHGILYSGSTSAKSGSGVERLFLALADEGVKCMTRNNAGVRNGHIAMLRDAPEWVPDTSCRSCCLCNEAFTFSNRRHHCRGCGLVFCNACSSKRTKIPMLGITSKVRVCDPCYQIHGSSLTSSSSSLLPGVTPRPISAVHDSATNPEPTSSPEGK